MPIYVTMRELMVLLKVGRVRVWKLAKSLGITPIGTRGRRRFPLEPFQSRILLKASQGYYRTEPPSVANVA